MGFRHVMRQKLYRSYLESEVLGADPLRLVCLLYRGAIQRVGEARDALVRRDIAARGRAVARAVAIVNELIASLDVERGGDISRNLARLYDYIARRLHEGNFTQTDAPFAEAEQLLRTLAEGWESCQPAAREQEPAEYAPVSCAG